MVRDSNENKKRKIQNEIKSIFEHLANEIIYEIFEYLDTYDLYEAFVNLNKRFQNLFVHSNHPLTVNISTMSKLKFTHYHKNIIIPNRHRINILRLSNLFTTNIVFSPPEVILKFIQLERLFLDHIDGTYLMNILNHSIHLSKFHSLNLHLRVCIENSSDILLQIFRLPKLKSCKLKFRSMDNLNFSSRSNNVLSSIEDFILQNCLSSESFKNLLSYLPRLRRLSIVLIPDRDHKEIDFSPLQLKSFKYVSLKIYEMNLNRLEQIIKNYFHYIEVFHITSCDDQSYLQAKKWEEIILSSMPNLRVFDIYHTGLEGTYHHLIKEFNSSFWINKQWFFEYQHTWNGDSPSGIFYSINPYRRKEYALDSPNNKQNCSNIQETNFKSVKHIRIGGKQLTNNSIYYFPNVNKLTIISYLKTSNHSIWNNLNQIIPLNQLTKLSVDDIGLPFEQLLELLRSTPNLHTIEYDGMFFNKVDLKLIEQTNTFQYVSTRNNVKKLNIYQEKCTKEKFEILMNLFLQLEYLKIGMTKKEVKQFVHCLPSKTNDKIHPLCLLHIARSHKKAIPEMNRLIRSEDYLIKHVSYGSNLWW